MARTKDARFSLIVAAMNEAAALQIAAYTWAPEEARRVSGGYCIQQRVPFRCVQIGLAERGTASGVLRSI